MIVDANIAISVDAFHPFQGQPAAWIAPMNILSLNQQISVISALTEGCSIRAIERLTGIHPDTIMHLAARIGLGAIKFHDRTVHSSSCPDRTRRSMVIRCQKTAHCTHGVLQKVYAAEPAKDAARRYSPGYVVAVERWNEIGPATLNVKI
jgi:hypothetical protein